ncbi:hypothetical protein [Caldifermentibacillus hisashii]|jgi:hypothetical protein|uniref:Uncharacterized protein n=1 Tax=Caldibacillus thermoamylovorans TaxID=35841 RepID=A0A090KMW6_9BACI|nr:hypothetical protein CEJ87_08830 [Caldifermentibacillus hisashii]CEE00029.1 hypothetical protein BT1A1_0158 [Caldibacillus thermoamylovorans]
MGSYSGVLIYQKDLRYGDILSNLSNPADFFKSDFINNRLYFKSAVRNNFNNFIYDYIQGIIPKEYVGGINTFIRMVLMGMIPVSSLVLTSLAELSLQEV